jgi:hypothetical protein
LPVSRKSQWIQGVEVVISGRFLKTISVSHEFDVPASSAEALVDELRKGNSGADIYTFMQRLPESYPKYPYTMAWDNVAAIPIKDYETWLLKQIYPNSRNKLKKAEKGGVVVRQLEFNDDLFRGIKEVQDECPVRQGNRFRHYGKPLETVRKEYSTYSDRATMLGAFFKDEMIGFLKIVPTDGFARTMGILTKTRYHEKAPMNALIAEAVKVCAEKKIPFLVYAQYAYGNSGSQTLMDFKASNGFEHILLPRYFVPLTFVGKLALMLRLHGDVRRFVPKPVAVRLRDLKSRFVDWRFGKMDQAGSPQKASSTPAQSRTTETGATTGQIESIASRTHE